MTGTSPLQWLIKFYIKTHLKILLKVHLKPFENTSHTVEIVLSAGKDAVDSSLGSTSNVMAAMFLQD